MPKEEKNYPYLTNENSNTSQTTEPISAPQPRYTFSSHERIKSRKTILTLVQDGFSFFDHSYKCVFTQISPQNARLQLCVSVPKSRIRQASVRNYLKRITREAWRQHKHLLIAHISPDTTLAVMLVYQKKEKITHHQAHTNIQNIIHKLITKIETKA